VNRIADWLAGVVRSTPPRFRRLLMRGPWGRAIAAVIFAAMPKRLQAASAAGLDLVVRWDVEEGPLRYLLVRDGTASIGHGAERDPDLTLGLDRVALLELATGAANGPQLFMTGRVRLSGDMMLGQRLTALFAVPGAG
jgi:putative sterol carrier protein